MGSPVIRKTRGPVLSLSPRLVLPMVSQGSAAGSIGRHGASEAGTPQARIAVHRSRAGKARPRRIILAIAIAVLAVGAGVGGYWYLRCWSGGKFGAMGMVAMAGWIADDHLEVSSWFTGHSGVTFDELSVEMTYADGLQHGSFDRPITLVNGVARANRCNSPLTSCTLTVTTPAGGPPGQLNLTFDFYIVGSWGDYGKWRFEIKRTYFCGTQVQAFTDFP